MFMGFSAAFAAALGFIWVDIVKPQNLAYSIISGQPLSFYAAAVTLALFAATDRKSPPRFGAILILLALFALWVTLTTSLSAFQASAWNKWDWVFKVLIFAVLIPYIFRSRVQIEAFILVFIFAASTIFFSAGVKTMLGGGGYGTLAIMGSGNVGLGESSTLAMVCVMLVPLIIFIMRHTLFFPKNLLTKGFFTGLIVAALATVVGTSARTGIIAMGVLCMLYALRSRKKLWWIAGAAVAGLVVANMNLSSTTWGSRMSTIETYDADSSALGRIAVWQWTLDYIGSNPIGGGFNAYLHNRILGVSEGGVITLVPEGQVGGKAFHSIYFEVLGEQGIPGFIIYYSMIVLCLLTLRRLKKAWRHEPGMAWLAALAEALTTSFAVFLAGGAFIGIAYQPYIFYMISLTVSIDQYARRVTQDRLKEKGRVKL